MARYAHTVCLCVVCVCASMTPWTLRVNKPRAAGLFTLNVLLRFPAQTYHIFQWAVALKITGACSTLGRLSSDHPFSKGLWFSNLLGVSFNTSPIGKPNSIQRPLVQRLKRLCSAITQVVLESGWNLVSLQVAVQTLLGQDDVNLTCFP